MNKLSIASVLLDVYCDDDLEPTPIYEPLNLFSAS